MERIHPRPESALLPQTSFRGTVPLGTANAAWGRTYSEKTEKKNVRQKLPADVPLSIAPRANRPLFLAARASLARAVGTAHAIGARAAL